MANFYDFSANTLQGNKTSMKDFEGKTVLVVNTASKCGLTPQYEGLEALYNKHKDNGLVVVGFPCNQFAEQEPGDANEIQQGCLVNYGVSFPVFEKVEVNGENAHPIYQYLRSEQPTDAPNEKAAGLIEKTKTMRQQFDETDVVWNFGKFLINKEGNVVNRFSPMATPEELEETISELL